MFLTLLYLSHAARKLLKIKVVCRKNSKNPLSTVVLKKKIAVSLLAALSTFKVTYP
jgi:hypothetical protein